MFIFHVVALNDDLDPSPMYFNAVPLSLTHAKGHSLVDLASSYLSLN